MSDNLFEAYKNNILSIIKHFFDNEIEASLLDRVTVEPPKNPEHGDFSCNAGMILAKALKKTPQEIAHTIQSELKKRSDIQSVSIAGPGFLNFTINEQKWINQIHLIQSHASNFGKNNSGEGKTINIEFVSANPTGPLTAGHARGAIFGDALSALLEWNGYKIIREYYINDAGAQIDVLANSTYLRYKEALGEEIGIIPEGLYPGEYLKKVGEYIKDKDGSKWLGLDKSEWLAYFRETAVEQLMADIKTDLKLLNIEMDVYTSEKAIIQQGAVDRAFRKLINSGYIYEGTLPPPKGQLDEDWEPREQTLFKASEFGDDQDRPLKKSDGSWTYFANDIAYHYDKFLRSNASELIDILGADHGGYIKRIKASTKAITNNTCPVDVKICQLVNLMNNGKTIRMSKRAGNFITLKEIIEKVGKDVMRFIMLTRSNDQALDFDFAKVIEQSKDNPVFYVQYASARCHSIIRHAIEEKMIKSTKDLDQILNLNELLHDDYQPIIKKLCQFPRIIDIAGKAHEPHRIATYLQELASEFHALWHKGKENAALKFIQTEHITETKARLVLIKCITIVLGSALSILGVQSVTEM